MQQENPPVYIFAEESSGQATAQQLADRYGFAICEAGSCSSDWALVVSAGRLELRQFGKRVPGPVYVDFVSGKNAHRRQYGGGRKQPLAKAVGIKSDWLPNVLDVTGGLGRDAFVLATLGCRVEMIERSPVVAALLADGLQRAALSNSTAVIAQRLSLVHGDALELLSNPKVLDSKPDTIYMDPMYPKREKSALVKKEMALFHRLVGEDADSGLLLKQAMQMEVKRVVVKRPAKSGYLADIKPGVSIHSPNTRYDVYLGLTK